MIKLALALASGLAATALAAQAPSSNAPFEVLPGLFAEDDPDLGLRAPTGLEHVIIFAPTAEDDRFNNGTVLIGFKGKLYAQWQSSERDEDSADTWVAYATSEDGTLWSEPRELRPAGAGGAMHSNGGWWTDGERLVAFTNVWPTGFQSGDGGYTEYSTSRDDVTWSEPRRVTDANGEPVEGIIEQDPHRLPSGRIINAFHLRPGMIVAPHFTDDPLATSGWVRGRMENLPHEGSVSRELEPSLYLAGECAVMVFRDQASSFRQLAAETCDQGVSWTQPALTSMPDSRSKQSAGNLPDGTAYLVNAPNAARERIPLAITLSDDGRCFDRAWLLRGRSELPPIRYEGRYKRPGFHYPKSTVWNGHLYVGYTLNKEDVALTKVPLDALSTHENSCTCSIGAPPGP